MENVIKGIIIDENNMNLGYIISMGNGRNRKEKKILTQEAKACGLVTRQLTFTKDRVIENGDQQLSALPTYMLKGNQFVQVDNTVKVIEKIEVGNNDDGYKIEGYTLLFKSNGKKARYRTSDIYEIARSWKCENFVPYRKADGEYFLKSKRGDKQLNEQLETVTVCNKNVQKIDRKPRVINNPKMSADVKSKASASANNDNSNKEIGRKVNMDIFEIFEKAQQFKCTMIKFQSENYSARSITKVSEEDQDANLFDAYWGDEFFKPYLKLSADKLNVSINTRVYGDVTIKREGKHDLIVPCYTTRTKNIIANGKFNMKRFGVIVDKDKASAFVSGISAVEKVITDKEDKEFFDKIDQILGLEDKVVVVINTSMVAITRSKTAKLTYEQLAQTVANIENIRLMSKYLGPHSGLIRKISDTINYSDGGKIEEKDLETSYIVKRIRETLTDEELEIAISNGINSLTGCYTPVYSAGRTQYDKYDQDIQIKFMMFKGLERITVNDIEEAIKAHDDSKINKNTLDILRPFAHMTKDAYTLSVIKEKYNTLQNGLQQLYKDLFINNINCIDDGVLRLNGHWYNTENKRFKKGKEFACSEIEANGGQLIVQVSNLDIM